MTARHFRTLCRALALAAALPAASCATFDKQGERILASVEAAAPPPALRDAILVTFGREGFLTAARETNPLVLNRPASLAYRIAYQTYVSGDLVNRATIDIQPAPVGSRAELRAVTLNRPGTMFESAFFPLAGTRSFYRRLLESAARQAAAAP
jgi:hypothetical protein